MIPIIYAFPKINTLEPGVPNNLTIEFDKNPSPKLIKYGFNNINEEIRAFGSEHYKAGLNFDFSRTDKKSMDAMSKEVFGVKKNDIKFDSNFAQFWEMLNVFGLLKKPNETIYTTNASTSEDVSKVYQILHKTKNTYHITEKAPKAASVVIYKYSEIDIDENASIQFIIDSMPKLLSSQTQGSSMILQLNSLQTQTSAEIIYYLASMYNEAYLTKPLASSDLSDIKYLVLIGFKPQPTFFPKIPPNTYLSSLGIKNLPENFVMVIQCINSEIIPKKYNTYNRIRAYIDSKVYEGATYESMINKQDENTKQWFETFGQAEGMDKLLDQALAESGNKCLSYGQLVDIFS